MELEDLSDDDGVKDAIVDQSSSQLMTELERQMNDDALRRQSLHILALTHPDDSSVLEASSVVDGTTMSDRHKSTCAASSGFSSVQYDGSVTGLSNNQHSIHTTTNSSSNTSKHAAASGIAGMVSDTARGRRRYEQRLQSKTEALNATAQNSSNAGAVSFDAASTKRNEMRTAVDGTDAANSSAPALTKANESAANVTSKLQQYTAPNQAQTQQGTTSSSYTTHNHKDTEDYKYIDDDGLMSPIEPTYDDSEDGIAEIHAQEPVAVIGAIRMPGINSSTADDRYSARTSTPDTEQFTVLRNRTNGVSTTHALTVEDMEAQMRSTIIADSMQAICVPAPQEESSNNIITDQDNSGSDNNYGSKNRTPTPSNNNNNSTFKKTRLLWMLLGAAGCIVFVVVCYIVVVVVAAVVSIAEAADTDTSGIDPVDDSSQPSLAPDSSSPTSPPAVIELQPFHFDFLDWLKETTINPEPLNVNSTSTATTPQYDAFTWLANDSIKSVNDIPTPNSPKSSLLLERYALACFYFSTVGDGWTVANNWLSERSVCEWYGIACDSARKVDEMNLELNNVQGYISEEIGHLVELRSLRLGSNAFNTSRTNFGKDDERIDRDHGSLRPGMPTTIGLLTNLDEIMIGRSGLGGTIPTEFGLLSAKLRVIRLKGSYIVGSIPMELGKLQNLVELELKGNELTGTLPPELGRLSVLSRLSVESNELAGTIPIEYVMGWPSRMNLIGLEDNLFDADTIEATFCNSSFGFSAVEITFSCPISTCSCCTNC